jgi:serine-type D-Ala-D-Ala carboxypeptidase (penicillin-binding protein 5/6)
LKRSFPKLAIVAAILAVLIGGSLQAQTIDTVARQAILIDLSTDTVLFEKNADQRMAPSSMSKIMTMYMVFERLREGRLKLDDRLPVSQRAWRMQGSKMFVELNNAIRVEDLIRGVIIQSGNDACIVLAEGLAGSEEAFSEQMTKRGRELGLVGSNFTNSTGWPDDRHYMTARDLALLSTRLLRDFPEYYKYYSEREFTYHGIKQGNRNPLLYRNVGADGIKTGHTEAAGYGLTGTIERNGRRLLVILNGLPSMQSRADESARLLEWGFREFSFVSMFRPGEVVDQVPVWMGVQQTVPVTVGAAAGLTLGRGQQAGMRVRVVMDGPAPAPIVKGAPVGKLVVTAPGLTPREFPLVAAADVERMGLFGRMATTAWHLVLGAAQ